MSHPSYGYTFGTIVAGGTLDDTIVISTGSIYVWGMTFSSTTAGDMDIFVEDNDGNDIANFTIPQFNSIAVDIPFLAGNGLSIRLATPSVNNTVMVTHSQVGA